VAGYKGGVIRMHLASLVEDMRRNGAQTAVVRFRGVRRHAASYAEVAELAGRFAAELERRGIGPGERVVVWGENSAEWVSGFFGCLLRGVLVVPLDAAGSAAFAARVLGEVRPRLVLADAARWDALDEAVRAACVRLDLESLGDSLPAEPLWTVAPEVTLDAPFQIVFTSGTTAEPKGIVHTHRNVLASVEPIEREIAKYRRYERAVHPLRMLHTLPLSHVFGQFLGLWIAPLLAMEVHLESRLDAGRIVRRIKAEKINTLIAVPRTLELLRAHLLADDPSLPAELEASRGMAAWKRWWVFRRVHRRLGFRFWAVICGGAALPGELELFWGRLGLAVIQGYGMTETAALITLNHPFHVGRGTLGKPLPGREVKLSDEGEILVRGDTVSTATWRDGHVETRVGEWLATGDLATADESGALRFAGRRSETIVGANGMNVYPADLEAELLRQPGVRAAAVVGCEGANGPEAVAVLVCEGDDAALQRALTGANGVLAEFQRMRRVLRWPEPGLPYTSTGKLMRRQVAAWACVQLAARTEGLSASVGGDALAAMVAEATGSRDAGVSGELGLDSLGRVQLQAALEERFGLELDEDAMAGVRTMEELRRLVGTAGVAPNGNAGISPLGSASVERTGVGAEAVEGFVGTSARVRGPEHRYPRWTWWTPVQWVRVLFQEVAMRAAVAGLATPRVEWSGADPQKPLLIVANHVTSYDVPLVLYGLPGAVRRRVAVAMAGEMLLDYRRGRGAVARWLDPLMPVVYWLITALFNVFPLPRLGGFRRSFEHAGAALDGGYSVLIFPEGRRSADGRMGQFRAGIGLLVQQAEVAVLPVALIGLGELKQRGRGWFRSGRVAVRVGEPMRFDAGQSAEEITAELERAVAALLES
jgi:long-chain acyl-CoA synthetase